MRYNVARTHFSQYVHREVQDGKWVETKRKAAQPAIAIISANSLTEALSKARQRFGHHVVVCDR